MGIERKGGLEENHSTFASGGASNQSSVVTLRPVALSFNSSVSVPTMDTSADAKPAFDRRAAKATMKGKRVFIQPLVVTCEGGATDDRETMQDLHTLD